MDPYPYGSNQPLGTLTDPSGQGTFNTSTNTFSEIVYATSNPTAAQSLLDRLIYTPPPLTDGEGTVVNAAIEVNNSDGSQTVPTIGNYLSIPTPYVRQLDNVTAPSISGTVGNQSVAAGGTLDPFAAVSPIKISCLSASRIRPCHRNR